MCWEGLSLGDVPVVAWDAVEILPTAPCGGCHGAARRAALLPAPVRGVWPRAAAHGHGAARVSGAGTHSSAVPQTGEAWAKCKVGVNSMSQTKQSI